MSLAEKLDKIKSPKLQNQHHTAVVLSAVEDTLRDQKTEPSPTAYFAALLALLSQAINAKGIVNKDLATSLVYLLDVVTPYVPQPLLRSKFSQILTNLAPALTQPEAEAPLLRPSIGCLESLLVAQDAAAWALPQTQIGPRRATAGLLTLAVDHRPKVRKRAQDALKKVLRRPPPSPSLDHPAADMCAETALQSLNEIAAAARKNKKNKGYGQDSHHEPGLIHAMQLVKTISSASGGWPSKKIEPLCELLMNISKTSSDYLTMSAFEVFETIVVGMANEVSSAKLPRLLDALQDLRPSQNDSQLLPPWIAVISRGYDVSAQINPEETFQKLPELFNMVFGFLASSSHNIRVSASECLISFMQNCVSNSVILEPSIFDEKVLEKLSRSANDLLSVKYQSAWMEVFNVLSSMFDAFKWRSDPLLVDALKTIGELRGNESFNGKKEADSVLASAVKAMGPEAVLRTLPLNLNKPKPGQPGRAWLLPILRDNVLNTNLAHFRNEFVPLSEIMFQRVLDHGDAEKTMQIKIFETLVQQTWALLPGYCTFPLDVTTAFDQNFAELLSNLLYKQTELRVDICRGLQNLVESNQTILDLELENEDLIMQQRITKADAKKNIMHLASFSGNLLAVLFNVYSETLPHFRGYILRCINAYLSITPANEVMDIFTRVASMLESSLAEVGPQRQADKQKQKKEESKMPPMSHTLMDLVITISVYLPRDSFASLFTIAALIINKDDDPQLQKKAYKLIPRLAESETGKVALADRNEELQQLLLSSASKASAPSRRDRLLAISSTLDFLPQTSLHFIPSILSEVVISCKESNEKARTAGFDLLVRMGEKMSEGGVVSNSKVPHMADDAPDAKASLEEYFTMVSAGLAGATPHMISASITALTRILFQFRQQLPAPMLAELVETMDLFLKSNNREVVRSVLGFVKVSIISLPMNLMLPRLETMIPNLFVWSHEHTGHFRQKIKHIFERMIRRFGYEIVEKWCPEEDKKLLINIKKTRERNKRKKNDNPDGEDGMSDDDSLTNTSRRRPGRYDNEFDEAVYGSDASSYSGSDASDDEVLGHNKQRKGKSASARNQQFIVEDDDEPLDLLDKRALANISTTRPRSTRTGQMPVQKTKAKVDEDGRLVLGEDDSDDEMMDFDADWAHHREPGDGSLEGGINAYVAAIKGKDAVKRGQRGKLKFSNKKGQEEADDDEEEDREMEVDQQQQDMKRNRMKAQMGGKGRSPGKKGTLAQRSGRKGLGAMKTRGGRVMKAGAGRGGGRR
ncbi:MAG: hypothetical protein M1834_002947 [Cirrosporium novae-zelandiae]|nr:MAG: hypothetical protein M1834_002947 [Cirrosporium novae-zelandiae]